MGSGGLPGARFRGLIHRGAGGLLREGGDSPPGTEPSDRGASGCTAERDAYTAERVVYIMEWTTRSMEQETCTAEQIAHSAVQLSHTPERAVRSAVGAACTSEQIARAPQPHTLFPIRAGVTSFSGERANPWEV